MPRATRSSVKASVHDVKAYPYPKSASNKLNNAQRKGDAESRAGLSNPKSRAPAEAKPRTGKDSHLYTDDNPATTLHGTGFKDASTALNTIELVQKRSLLYQFQTINTMYHRAKHHPHSSNNKDMQAAMAIYREWLDTTYPAVKEAQTDFSPLLRKDAIEKYLPRIQDQGLDTKWAEKYIGLAKGKRLANVLMNDDEPGEADLARARQDALEDLMRGRDEEKPPGKDEGVLWDESDVGVSFWHLKCIAYGWSPVKSDVLLKRLG